MAKTENPHSVRLYDSLFKHLGKETAERIAHKIPLSNSADARKKFIWAESISADLEKELDDETIKLIRMDCACGPDAGKISTLKKVYQSSTGLQDFAEKASGLKQGFELEYKDQSLHLFYPQCYCSCVKRIQQPISKAWCYCTLGYTKKMFEAILERPVEALLLDSVKMGGKHCIIKII